MTTTELENLTKQKFLFKINFLTTGVGMERRHEDSIANKLEEAHLNGVSHITWDELYCWYGVQKIAAGTYRDLDDRWKILTDNEEGSLMKIEGRGGIYLFGELNATKVYQDNTPNKL